MTENRTGFAEMGTMMGDLAPYQFVFEMLMSGVATATIVKVMAVDGDTVDVQPMVNQINGAGTGVAHGTINGIPWVCLQGGSSAISVAPAKGDKGLCVFCHNDISGVKNTQDVANPSTYRRHSWSDGVYVGGLPMLNAAATTFVKVSDADGVTITAAAPKPVTINAPGGATINGNVTVNGSVTATGDVTGNGTSLHSHVHSGVSAGSANTGAPV